MIGLFTKRSVNVIQALRSGQWRWLASGLLLGACFIAPWLSWLVVPGLWLYVSAWQRADTYRGVWWGTLLSGTLQSLGAISSGFHTYPLGLITGVSPLIEYSLITSVLVYFSLALAIGKSVVLVGWYQTESRWPQLHLLFPVAWVVAEIIGSLVFSIAALGAGSTLNIDFSFGYVGYLLADSHLLLYVARIGGVYALGVLLVAGVYGVYLYIKNRPRYVSVLMLFLLIGSVMLSNRLVPSPVPHVSSDALAVINTDFSHSLFEPLSLRVAEQVRVRDVVREKLTTKPAVIALPEGAEFTLNFADPRAALEYLTLHAEAPVVVIDSLSVGGVITAGRNTVRAYIYDTGTQSIYVIDKQQLTPVGEYTPYALAFFSRFIPHVGGAQIIQPNYQPGEAVDYGDIPEALPAVLFCFESVSPLSAHRLIAETNAPYIVHLTSYSWFHHSKSLFLAVDRMVAVSSVWSGVPIVAANNQKTAPVRDWERWLGWR